MENWSGDAGASECRQRLGDDLMNIIRMVRENGVRAIRTSIVVSASIAIGACCCVGGGGHAKPGEVVKGSAKVMGDPGRIKNVHKVAVVSVVAGCPVTDESIEGRNSGNDKSVFGAIHAVKTMQNLDATES